MSDAGERRAPGGAPKRRGGRQKNITVAEKVERDRKVISIDEKLRKGGGGWPGMGVDLEDEDGYPTADSFFNLRGATEAECWPEWARRYGPSG